MKNNLKDILKNSWDIFPGINEFQWMRNAIKTGNNLYSKSYENMPSTLKILGRTFLTSIYVVGGILAYSTGSLNPKEWDRQIQERYNNIQEQIQYQSKIDSIYQTIFQDVKTLEDSLKISKEYKIPPKLILKPLFKDKERIATSLEKELKNKK